MVKGALVPPVRARCAASADGQSHMHKVAEKLADKLAYRLVSQSQHCMGKLVLQTLSSQHAKLDDTVFAKPHVTPHTRPDTPHMNARNYHMIAAFHSSYSGGKPVQSDGWCKWTTVPAHECPTNMGWLSVLFPNARVDIKASHMANVDASAACNPPRALVELFANIPHGNGNMR